jgi:hypothetical protein
MPSTRQGFVTGLLLVLLPPVGLVCLWVLLRDRRAAIRARGEATERRRPRVEAMLVAPATAREPRRPREREAWTQMEDYFG